MCSFVAIWLFIFLLYYFYSDFASHALTVPNTNSCCSPKRSLVAYGSMHVINEKIHRHSVLVGCALSILSHHFSNLSVSLSRLIEIFMWCDGARSPFFRRLVGVRQP